MLIVFRKYFQKDLAFLLINCLDNKPVVKTEKEKASTCSQWLSSFLYALSIQGQIKSLTKLFWSEIIKESEGNEDRIGIRLYLYRNGPSI